MLKIPRRALPQIDDIDKFIKFCKSYDISSIYTHIPANKLIPIQQEINPEKVNQMAFDDKSVKVSHPYVIRDDEKPIIISLNKYILDGHHRWVSKYSQDRSALVYCCLFNCKLSTLFQLGHSFS